MTGIEVKVSENRGYLIIANPPMNFLPKVVLESLVQGFEDLCANSQVEVIILRGQGDVFVAGVDVNLIYESAKVGNREAVRNLLTGLHQSFNKMTGGSKPVIAAINGYCFGGGLELALACDYIIASGDAKTVQFSCPEISLGIIPGLGATQRLPRRINPRYALKMLLGGRSVAVGSELANQAGLVDEVVKGDFNRGIKDFATRVLNSTISRPQGRELPRIGVPSLSLEEFIELAKGNPVVPARVINRVVQEGLKLDLQQALFEVELPALLDCLFDFDALEGLSAFVVKPKRLPVFQAVVGEQAKISFLEKSSQPEISKEYAEVPPWEKDEFKLIRQTVREFGEHNLTWPQVRQMEKTETVSRELLGKMAELGLFGAGFPEKYGGTNMGKIGVCVLADELAYFHPATAVVMGASSSLAGEAIYLFGDEDQKQKYLVSVIEGKKIGAFATTEPKIGSDIANISTMAKKVDGGWQLRGSKQFITNGEIADFVIVAAQTDSDGGQKTLSLFIVDTGSKGFAITKREEKMGIHASRTNSFALDDVFVPVADVLVDSSDGKKKGFKAIMKIFNHSRITVAAGCIGMMRRVIDEAWKYAKDRPLFGEPMYMKQNTVMEFGKMRANLYAVESLVFDAAWKLDRGLDVRNEAAAVKYFAAETAFNVIDRASQLHGGNRFIADFPIEMFQRDIVVFRVFEGTSEVNALSLGKDFIISRVL